MIRETLAVLSEGKSVGEIGKELGINREDAKGRLEVLKNMGYIRGAVTADINSRACKLCPSSDACSSCSSRLETYSLTKKGRKILSK